MVVGIDPGATKPHAMAVIHNDVLIHSGPVSQDIHIVFDWIKKYQPDLVAIEGQYAGPNIKVLIQLAEARGKLIAACQYAGIRYEVIQPQQWLNSIGLSNRTKRGPERDAWVMKMARGLFKNMPVPDNFDIDQAAAIHIASYSFKRWCFKKKTQRENL